MVYPKFPATYWSYEYALPFVGKKSLQPPLGLMTVAAMLPESFEVSLIDLNVSSDGLVDSIEKSDLVFLSAMIIQKESFQSVVEMCRNAGVPVVAGGPYPISSHEQIEGVSHFVLDEAEVTLPRFLQDYEQGTPQYIYRSGGEKPDLSVNGLT